MITVRTVLLCAFVGLAMISVSGCDLARSSAESKGSSETWGIELPYNPFRASLDLANLTRAKLEGLLPAKEKVKVTRKNSVSNSELWDIEIPTTGSGDEFWLVRFTQSGQVCSVQVLYPVASEGAVVPGYESVLTREPWHSGMSGSEVSDVLGVNVTPCDVDFADLPSTEPYSTLPKIQFQEFQYVDTSTEPHGWFGFRFTEGGLYSINVIYRKLR